MESSSSEYLSILLPLKVELEFLRHQARKRHCKKCKHNSTFIQCEAPCNVRPKIGPSRKVKLNEFNKRVNNSNSTGSATQNEDTLCLEDDEKLWTNIHAAIYYCNARSTEKLIVKYGINKLTKFKPDFPFLGFAIVSGCVHITEVLIDHGFSIDENSLTYCLLQAIQDKNYHMIKFLVHNGADIIRPMIRNDEQIIPLHVALLETNVKIAKFLLAHGASVDAVDEKGETALFKATKALLYKCIPLLLKYGANICHKNNKSESALHLAMQYCYHSRKTVKFLVQGGADVNAETNCKETPLHTASREFYFSSCQDRGAIVVRRWHYEFNNIHDFNAHSPNPIEQLLKFKTVKVNAKNARGQTPLHLAVTNGYPYLVQQLLDAGADVDAADERGVTPLMIAVEKGNPHVVRQLLVAGADPGPFFFAKYSECTISVKVSPDVEREFVKYFIARRAAGLGVRASLFSQMSIDDEMKSFERTCLEEVDYMKQAVISEDDDEKSKMTLLNFLRASRRRLASVSIKDEYFLNFITEKDFNALPIYRDMLEFNFFAIMSYAPVLGEATENLNAIFRQQLPVIVLEAIICKLDVDDLNKIIEAYKITRSV